ncbi:MAG TPA: alanine glycine permease [Microscillaceae bacterium]|nr:alanine glycine permease [Microscillaceae bacterium]
MTRYIFTLAFILFQFIFLPSFSNAQSKEKGTQAQSIDKAIDAMMQPVADFIETVIFFKVEIATYKIPFVLIWLIGGAIFFTLYLGFINIWYFGHALDLVWGKYDNPDDAGEVSHFQALTAALSGTVGIGNIAGVAMAISIGGPGATFWIIVAGLLGMTSKFVECSLGVKYRKINVNGIVSGGPMYYLSKGLSENPKTKTLGRVLAALFALACVGGATGGGNMVQINQATQQFILITGGEQSFLYGQGWVFGVVMASLVALIIIGGIKSIAKVTDKIVPFMVGIYILAAFAIFAANFERIPTALLSIFTGAFAPDAVYGGFVAVLIIGFQRAAFSNEAGIGSASIAHSAAKTNHPISEGMVALLEPFIDTVVICTMTALVIVISGTYQSNSAAPEGIALTSRAFATVIDWFPIILSIAVILFALSTMISWSYYGQKSWEYLFGDSYLSILIYKLVFCIFIVIGSALSLGKVFALGDAMIFAMCFPNMFGLYFFAKEIKQDLREYVADLRSGKIKKYR